MFKTLLSLLLLPLALQHLLLPAIQQAEPDGRFSALGPITQHYLFMQPIQEAVQNGRFSALGLICRPRLSLSLEEPFSLSGYLSKEQFIEEFSIRFQRLETEKIEWSSIQVEEDIAVQSLNLILKNRISGQRVFYKLILFMSKEKEWQLYYLRGLKI
jgi:hypothetical protein